MARTIQQIINAAQLELGLPVISDVFASTDQTTQQMIGMANLEIEELRQAHDEGWTALQSEYDFTINVATSTTGDITENSAIITNIPDTTGITAEYFMISAPYTLAATRVVEVLSTHSVRMSMPATGTQVGATILFMQDTYPEPSDFDFFINQTWWDRTNRWQLLGPDSPQLDQWHRSGIVTTGPRRHFRQIGALANTYRIWPPPGNDVVEPISLVFEYQSRNAVYALGVKTARQFNFTANLDQPVLDDRAVIMGIKWRFWAQKGLDWKILRSDYDDYVQRLIARDGGARILNMVSLPDSILLNTYQVQDGFFPGPGNP